MIRKRLYRNERATTGGRALARAAGLIVLNRGSTWRGRPQDVIVNWGAADDHLGEPRRCRWLNHPDAVARAVDKIETLKALDAANVPTLEWTTQLEEASRWHEEDGIVIGRRLLCASAGKGIIVCKRNEEGHPGHLPSDFPRTPLWTRYFKGSDEFRIHVAGGKVIDRQQKRRRLDEDGNHDATNEVRNLDNGWVFCRDEVEQIEMADSAACAAVAGLGLDFGAVDLKVNAQRTRVGVLEVNTAPGLEGTSLQVYARAIGEMV